MPSIGKISGLCADYSQATVNGRGYDKIYERILSGKDLRYNQMMQRGGIPCELGHPTDLDENGLPRTETDPTKIAAIITEIKKIGPKQLMATAEIMDTPNGKIFKTLSEYYDFGFSSRGSYEVPDEPEDDVFGRVNGLKGVGLAPHFTAEGPDGWNQDSYVFKGFDLVLLPATTKSIISATESIGTSHKRKIVKVAREAIDVNLLAKASQVSEDQVEEALDQLFKIDDNAEKSEEVEISEMKEKFEEDGSLNEEASENPEENGETEEEVKPTTIVNGEDVEKIKADLQTALDQIKALTEDSEKDKADLTTSNAEISRLTTENEDLRSELEERTTEAEQLVEKMESLKELSSKLLEAYKGAKEIFESKSNEASEKESELTSKAEEAESKKKEAEESLEREKRISGALRTELKAAKESLISAYSLTYGVSTEAIKSSLGNNYTVKKIRPAAEALANQIMPPTGIPLPVTRKRPASATESFQPVDEVERELMATIKEEN